MILPTIQHSRIDDNYMAYEINMAQDGVLRISLKGNIDQSDMNSFLKDFNLYLEASTESSPVHSIALVEQIRNISREARNKFIELNQDKRSGNIAYVGNNRLFRVLAKFMNKAAKRNNVRQFSNEKEALAWLEGQYSESIPNPQTEILPTRLVKND